MIICPHTNRACDRGCDADDACNGFKEVAQGMTCKVCGSDCGQCGGPITDPSYDNQERRLWGHYPTLSSRILNVVQGWREVLRLLWSPDGLCREAQEHDMHHTALPERD